MNDTLIFLVLAGLALVFKWLTSQGSSDAEKPEPPQPNEQAPPRRPPPQSEEERVRRFLEALGVPPGTQAPPPVRPRTFTPRPVMTAAPRTPPPKIKRSWVQPLPPVVTTPEGMPLPPLTTTPPPEPVFVVEAQPAPVAAAPPPLPAELSAPEISALPARKAAPARALPMTSLGQILRSREKIRQAIILREVLGPPLGLEPFGQLPGQ